MQPCMSPVWDTAHALYALGEAGVPRNDPRMLKAADWLLPKEVAHKGDWAVKVRRREPGGWYFEFNNEFYPDTDDTAQVLLALSKVDTSARALPARGRAARHRVGVRHAVPQRRLGSFDKDNTKMIFQYIPFADHNAMLDPPTVDITGRMLEMLAAYGYTPKDKRVEKAIKFILQRAGAGRKLVRPLGRELHLRHLPGAARPGCHRRRTSTSRRCSRRRSGCAWCRTLTAAGARPAAATTIPTPAASGRARHRKPPGPCWACWRRATRAVTPCAQGRALAAGASTARRRWDERWDEGAREAYHRHRLPQSFLSGIHDVPRSTSRSWRLRLSATRAAWQLDGEQSLR